LTGNLLGGYPEALFGVALEAQSSVTFAHGGVSVEEEIKA
jgi:hypothetical protein